jgi:hypothetical protein
VICTHFLKRFVFALLPPVASLADSYGPILDQIKPNTITIVNESHKKPSLLMFKSLALVGIKNYQCIVIWLKIISDQQTILNAVE